MDSNQHTGCLFRSLLFPCWFIRVFIYSGYKPFVRYIHVLLISQSVGYYLDLFIILILSFEKWKILILMELIDQSFPLRGSLFVSFKKIFPASRSWRYSVRFSSRSFIALQVTFRSVIQLGIWCAVEVKVHFFPYSSVLKTHLCPHTLQYQLCCKPGECIWIYSWNACSVPLLHLFILAPVHCFNFWSFILNLEIW